MLLRGMGEEVIYPDMKLVKDEKGVRFLEATLDDFTFRKKLELYDWQILVDGQAEQQKAKAMEICNEIRKAFVQRLGKSVTVMMTTFG